MPGDQLSRSPAEKGLRRNAVTVGRAASDSALITMTGVPRQAGTVRSRPNSCSPPMRGIIQSVTMICGDHARNCFRASRPSHACAPRGRDR